MNDQPVTALVILIVFSLVGFSAIYIAIVGGLESKKRFERERTHVTGRIVELIPRKDRFGRQSINTFWYPVVSFMVDGRERKVESRDAFPRATSPKETKWRSGTMLMIRAISISSSTRKTTAGPAGLSRGSESPA